LSKYTLIVFQFIPNWKPHFVLIEKGVLVTRDKSLISYTQIKYPPCLFCISNVFTVKFETLLIQLV